MKLLIAVPTMDFLHVEFVQSMTNLIMRLNRDHIWFEVKYISGSLVYAARDKLACHAINNEFTHVLWLDSDMVFQDSILDDLMFSGEEFVSGRFNARRKPFVTCQFSKLVPLERVEKYPVETFRIAGCGFGCVLTSVELLREIQMHYQTCFLPMAGFGEDLAFCVRATEMGHKIFCEPTAVVGHVAHIAIYPEDHERCMAEISNYDEVKGG